MKFNNPRMGQLLSPYYRAKDKAESNYWLLIAFWLFITYCSYGVIVWAVAIIFPAFERWLN